MNRGIRAATVIRANGCCEACGGGLGPDSERGHYDHFWSRRHGESVESGWLLCPPCDLAKTTNEPTQSYWLVRWIRHAAEYDYLDQIDQALIRLEVLSVKRLTA